MRPTRFKLPKATPRGSCSFGRFRFDPSQQLLLDGDTPVRLGSRALEILATLLDHAGKVVSRDEILARVWPDSVVEATNLKVHIAALRRALGKHHIETVSGAGYRFVAPVERGQRVRTDLPATRASVGLIGREITLNQLTGQLTRGRFVTLVGTGGVGKSTVAAALARRLSNHCSDGLISIDLATLKSAERVPRALAAALGIEARTHNTLAALIQHLRDRRLLIILDNCERWLEAAAVCAERSVNAAPHVHILATSREALRAGGEQIHRLEPLEYPPMPAADPTLTAARARTFPAVELFVAHATASRETYQLLDPGAATVAALCRKLDGLPLAIEIVAARMASCTAAELLTLVNDARWLLAQSSRSAIPRHRSLAAALAWSYERLSNTERAVLQRLSVLPGPFGLQTALNQATRRELPAALVIEVLASLVAQSLILARSFDGETRYQLLATTRAYALMQEAIPS